MASKESLEDNFEERALLITFTQTPSTDSQEKVRDRLQIHFQKRKLGGGDVDRVLYPLQGYSNKAIVVFSPGTNADITHLIKSKHIVDLGKGVNVNVITEAIPEMFQEIRLVINPFYLSLLPRDKTDELKHVLQAKAEAHIEHTSTASIIHVLNTQDIEIVRRVIAKVVGQATEDTSDGVITQNEYTSKKELTDKDMNVNLKDKDHHRRYGAAGNSVDRSVRPKVPTAKSPSYHDDKLATDGEQEALHPYHAGQMSNGTQKLPNRIAASFSNQPPSTSSPQSMEDEDGSDLEYESQLKTIPSNDSVPSFRGPLSVNTLLYKYLKAKHSNDLSAIRQKYRVEIEFIPSQNRGAEGEVKIKSKMGVRRTSKQLDEAEADFVTLYQACYQRITISKPVSCNSIGSHKITKAISYIWTQQPSVLIEDSIDDEVTFIGEEREVSAAIKEFQKTTGLRTKSRKLKHPTGASSPPMPNSLFSMNTNEALSPSRSNYGGAVSMQQGASELVKEIRCKTDEGIDVIAKKDDITRQHVDVIVNPANGDLTLEAGVGGALLRVAGQSLKVECENIRRRNGRTFMETDCVSSRGYTLPCQHVVHAVGPSRGYGNNQQDAFYKKLQDTFLNCFTQANGLNAKSIAVPLIGSGTFGGPKELCSKALIDAVKYYSKMEPNKTINSIILVNKDDEAYDATVKTMTWLNTNDNDEWMDTSSKMQTSQNKQPFWQEKIAATEKKTNTDSDVEIDRRPGIDQHRARSYDDTMMEQQKEYVTGGVQIIVKQQDILESVKEVDGIIVPTDSMLSNSGDIANTISVAAGLNMDDLKAKTNGFRVREGEIIHTDGNDLGSVQIIFVVPPEDKYGSRQDFFDKLERVVDSCLQYADKILCLKRVALPLFPPNVCSKELCSEVFAGAICKYSQSAPKHIREVHLVNNDFEASIALQSVLGEEFNDAASESENVNGAYATFGGNGASGSAPFEHKYSVRADGSVKHTRSSSGASGNSDKTDDKLDESEGNESEESDDDDKRCPICLEDFDDKKQAKDLSKCKHKFCQECLDKAMKHKPVCPVCGVVYGVMKGNQPPGTMNVSESRFPSVHGYEGYGTITIHYSFRNGTQGSDHPEPGNYYSGTSRTAYLPNNTEGKRVLSLLRKAFDAGLTFTIGTSVTTGMKNVVTWNDIHHKTSPSGGAQNFGYPDPTYLTRVTEELAAKGIK